MWNGKTQILTLFVMTNRFQLNSFILVFIHRSRKQQLQHIDLFITCRMKWIVMFLWSQKIQRQEHGAQHRTLRDARWVRPFQRRNHPGEVRNVCLRMQNLFIPCFSAVGLFDRINQKKCSVNPILRENWLIEASIPVNLQQQFGGLYVGKLYFERQRHIQNTDGIISLFIHWWSDYLK